MSKHAVLNITPAAHAAVRAASAAAGVSMSAWASERLTAHDADEETERVWQLKQDRADADKRVIDLEVALEGLAGDCVTPDQGLARLTRMASARSQTPAETLSAALDALERTAVGSAPERPVNPHLAPWERR